MARRGTFRRIRAWSIRWVTVRCRLYAANGTERFAATGAHRSFRGYVHAVVHAVHARRPCPCDVITLKLWNTRVFLFRHVPYVLRAPHVMGSYNVHRVNFFLPELLSVQCMVVENETQKLAVGR